MLASLSRVPPVWPRPRPEIIGTKPPAAARMGASIRLTLSPTPPVECLSSTGPGRSRSCQWSLRPDPVMCRVRATVSSSLMPRWKTAMAKAATWPSAMEPSAMPRMKKPISASLKARPSRFRRMISCGSMSAHPGEERLEKTGQIRHGTRGGIEGLAVMERIAAHPGAEIGDDRQRRGPEPRRARQDHLRHHRHSHEIGAQHAHGADLRRCLELWPAEPGIDALMQGDLGGFGGLPQLLAQAGVVGRAHIQEAARPRLADEGRGPCQTEMIADGDQAARARLGPQAPGGAGEQQSRAAEGSEGLDGRPHGIGAPTLIVMRTALQQRDGKAARLAQYEAPCMAGDARRWK